MQLMHIKKQKIPESLKKKSKKLKNTCILWISKRSLLF